VATTPARALPAATVFVAMSAVGGFLLSVVGTLSSVYLILEVGLDPLQLVLVGTVLEGTALVFEIPTGVVADVVSRRTSVVIGTLLTGVGFCLYAVPAFGVILAAQVVWGLGATFVSGAAVAWMVDEVGEDDAGPLLLRGAQAARVAAFVGIGASVALGAVALWLPVLAGGLTSIALGLWLAAAMPEQGFARPPPTRPWTAAADTLRATASSVRAGGLLLAIGATVVIRRRLDVRGAGAAARALLVVDGLQLVAGVAYGLASSLAVAVAAYWAGSLLRQLHGPLFNTWLNTGLASRSRATVNSAASQADALGQVAGGPVLGLIASARSVAAALVASGLVRAPTLAVLARSRTPR